jgi:hypothetical protein
VVTKTTFLWKHGAQGTGGELEPPLLELIQRADLLREGKAAIQTCRLAGDPCSGEKMTLKSWNEGLMPEQITSTFPDRTEAHPPLHGFKGSGPIKSLMNYEE